MKNYTVQQVREAMKKFPKYLKGLHSAADKYNNGVTDDDLDIFELYNDVYRQTARALDKRLRDNDYYDPDTEAEKYKAYWQAKRDIDTWRDTYGDVNDFMIGRIIQERQRQNDEMYAPKQLEDGATLVSLLRHEDDNNYISTEDIPANSVFAEDVINPYTGDIIVKEGYQPTSKDLVTLVNDYDIEQVVIRPKRETDQLFVGNILKGIDRKY